MGGYGHDLKHDTDSKPILILDRGSEEDGPRFLWIKMEWDELTDLRDFLSSRLAWRPSPKAEE